MQLRKSLFAGSWYENDKTKLSRLLKKHFDRAEAEQSKFCGDVKAIISPHAGYDYSGEIAACAYQAINPQKIKTVFVLGPSHQIYTNKCLLTTFDRFYTPFGDIEIDKNIVKDLLQQPGFSKHEPYDDEKEHSIDLCCPMLKYRMAEQRFKLVPIMVGELDEKRARNAARTLNKYFVNENSLFVISSDFCHWGEKFNFKFYNEKWGDLRASITKLDKMGMEAISTKELAKFGEYLDKYRNTICGRYPILLLLAILEENNCNYKFDWINYGHSKKTGDLSHDEYSVSYVAGLLSK